jgi:hypothetical protein
VEAPVFPGNMQTQKGMPLDAAIAGMS